MTVSQIIACVITVGAAVIAVWALALTRRARPGVPYTPRPREHCGDVKPALSESDASAECVLRPGHEGSHADDQGARWWFARKAGPQDGTVCAAYRVPASAVDSGLCARCGMFDYKHQEATGG